MLRVRFAPSPTGSLHIGSARTIILNWPYARQQYGTMIPSIYDADVHHNANRPSQSICDGFRWPAIAWDEECGQSERVDLNAKMARKIFGKGMVYRYFTLASKDGEPDRSQCSWRWEGSGRSPGQGAFQW